MSHGRLIHHQLKSSTDLSHVPLGDLGAELLVRLTNPTSHDSRKEFEKHLQMLSALNRVTGEVMEVPENRVSIAHFGTQFRFVHHCWKSHKIPIEGAVHVDIGCGSVNPLARLFTHLMLGVDRVVGIDLDVPTDLDESARNLARLAGAAILDPSRIYGDYPITPQKVLGNLAGFDLAKLQRGDPSGADQRRMGLLQKPIESTGLATASVDVVISNSVFEHLPQLDATLAELARITKPGGYGLHGIDTVDHRWYGEPHLHQLEFLTLNSKEPIVFGCNRVRLFEFPELFRRHGFEIVERWTHNKVVISPEFRARMVEPWKSMPDELLDTTWAQVLIRRR
jgi:SAM-dependent methyltransferase